MRAVRGHQRLVLHVDIVACSQLNNISLTLSAIVDLARVLKLLIILILVLHDRLCYSERYLLKLGEFLSLIKRRGLVNAAVGLQVPFIFLIVH